MDKLKQLLLSVSFGDEIARDYYAGYTVGYIEDLKKFSRAKEKSLELMNTIGHVTPELLDEACKNAFSGRIEIVKDDKAYYTAGQFYDIEVPQAVLAVLEYIKAHQN